MAGLKFEGDSDEVEVVPNKKLVSKNEGGIESTITWLMDEHGEDTDLTFEVDHHIPVPVLGRLAEEGVVRMKENEADTCRPPTMGPQSRSRFGGTRYAENPSSNLCRTSTRR